MNLISGSAEPTDAELWRRAVAGHADSFGVLFERHGDALRGYCARRTGSPEGVDDLVSTVFLEAWRRRDEVVLHDDRVLPWLYGVARMTVNNRWRTTIRHRRALARLAPADAYPDHADEVAARVDDQRHLSDLRAAFTGLRRIDQEILTLCVWQGLDYAGASVALDIPIGTVRSRLSRARGHDPHALTDDAATPFGDPRPVDRRGRTRRRGSR